MIYRLSARTQRLNRYVQTTHIKRHPPARNTSHLSPETRENRGLSEGKIAFRGFYSRPTLDRTSGRTPKNSQINTLNWTELVRPKTGTSRRKENRTPAQRRTCWRALQETQSLSHSSRSKCRWNRYTAPKVGNFDIRILSILQQFLRHPSQPRSNAPHRLLSIPWYHSQRSRIDSDPAWLPSPPHFVSPRPSTGYRTQGWTPGDQSKPFIGASLRVSARERTARQSGSGSWVRWVHRRSVPSHLM